MTTAAISIDATRSIGVKRALMARRRINRLVHNVDSSRRISTAEPESAASEMAAIDYTSAGARRALVARRRINRLVHGIDCSCRIETREGQPSACLCGAATVGQC